MLSHGDFFGEESVVAKMENGNPQPNPQPGAYYHTYSVCIRCVYTVCVLRRLAVLESNGILLY